MKTVESNGRRGRGEAAEIGTIGASTIVCCLVPLAAISGALNAANAALGWDVLKANGWDSGDWTKEKLALSAFVGNLILAIPAGGLGSGLHASQREDGTNIHIHASGLIVNCGIAACSTLLGGLIYNQLHGNSINMGFAAGASAVGAAIIGPAVEITIACIACCALSCMAVSGDNPEFENLDAVLIENASDDEPDFGQPQNKVDPSEPESEAPAKTEGGILSFLYNTAASASKGVSYMVGGKGLSDSVSNLFAVTDGNGSRRRNLPRAHTI